MSKSGNCIILFYHRLSDETTDLFNLSVGTQRFADHMSVVREMAEVVPLSMIRDGRGPRVAITFDDGYASGFAAEPVEALAGLPVTVFVVSGKIGSERGFWWDELVQLLLTHSTFPNTVEIELRGRDLWMHTATPAGRERAALALQSRLSGMPLDDIESQIDSLRAQVGTDGHTRTAHRTMTEDELRALAARPNVEIGAHTVTHAALNLIPADEQRIEIEGSRSRLMAIAGAVTSFAYPYGQLGEESVAIVRQAGFERACTTEQGPVRPVTDPYLIPRYQVEDWSSDEFRNRLQRWLQES